MASTYLTRTPSSSGNRKTWTLSMWVKRSNDNYSQLSGTGTGSTYFIIGFGDTQPRILQSANAGESVEVQINNKCRDVNGYYHLVFRVDTTQATASDRIRIYINGEEGTYSQTDYPSQNLDMYYNYNILHGIGARADNDAHFEGIMSHVHFSDGYSYDASTFGETDATTGEWKIKTNPAFTLGNNGFTILKDGNTYTDQSSNSNNFTLSGTLTKTEDCPSNVFATLNPLIATASGFSNSNTTFTNSDSTHKFAGTTLGVKNGKYYFEAKCTTRGSAAGATKVGVVRVDDDLYGTSNFNVGDKTLAFVFNAQAEKQTGGAGSSYGTSYTDGDIIGVAVDMDNHNLYFHKNGTYQNSGVPTSGSTGTGAISLTSGDFYMPCLGGYGGTVWNLNFGNGYFGTTAVSSAGTNASGIGIFEYDVPTGYTALSTKGLNE